jgi:EamA-like transporter family.
LGAPKDGTSIILLIILGIFQLGIPYILYARAVKNVSALEVTLIPIIEPLLNPIWVFIFNSEVPSTYSLIGGGIVLVSVTIRTLYVLNKEQ